MQISYTIKITDITTIVDHNNGDECTAFKNAFLFSTLIGITKTLGPF
jgi:hypothetical protein